MAPSEQDQQDIETARAVWDDLAARARGMHCPVHFVEPWRVVVIGDPPSRLRLQIYGCCSRLQDLANELIASDPRISGPS